VATLTQVALALFLAALALIVAALAQAT